MRPRRVFRGRGFQWLNGDVRISPLLFATLVATVFIPAPACAAQADVPWKAGEVVPPAELAKRLGKQGAPLILHIGPPVLYDGGHIPGAPKVGPGATPDGIRRMHAHVRGVPKDREIVIYCGCCPTSECPNAKPAYKSLKARGYKNVKVLDLPTDFTIDWAKKGLPVEKGKPKP